MKKIIVLLAIVAFLVSCSRSVTVQQAANNHYKRCRAVK
jgi:hypothetical protein